MDKEDQMVVDELSETLKEWSKALKKFYIGAAAEMVGMWIHLVDW